MFDDKYNDINNTNNTDNINIEETDTKKPNPVTELNDLIDEIYEDIIQTERESVQRETELDIRRGNYMTFCTLSAIDVGVMAVFIIIAIIKQKNGGSYGETFGIMMKYILPSVALFLCFDTISAGYRRLIKHSEAVQNRSVLLNSSLNGIKARRDLALKGEEVSTEYIPIPPVVAPQSPNYSVRCVVIILLSLLWCGYGFGSYINSRPQRVSGTSSVVSNDDMNVIPNEAGKVINETEATTEQTLDGLAVDGKTLLTMPSYSESAINGEKKSVTYEWYCKFSKWSQTMDIPVRNYEFFKLRRRTIDGMDYAGYIEDKTDDEFIKSLADTMCQNGADKGYDEFEQVELLVSFVQSLDYIEDTDEDGNPTEYPKYPIETLYDKGGDCEDTAILLASLLRARGYQTALIKLPEHVAVGVKGTKDGMTGSYYELNGDRYYYIETTNKNWAVGELPEEYKGQDAEVILVN